MKSDVVCPLCKLTLGRFHANASGAPLRDHIYSAHPNEYEEIVVIIEQIDGLYKKLKTYGVSHWTKTYFHRNVRVEQSLTGTPPQTSEEARKELVRKIKNQTTGNQNG